MHGAVVGGDASKTVSALGMRAATPNDAVRAADQEWMRAFSARDLVKTSAMCAKDASVLSPNAPLPPGRKPPVSCLARSIAFRTLTFRGMWEAPWPLAINGKLNVKLDIFNSDLAPVGAG